MLAPKAFPNAALICFIKKFSFMVFRLNLAVSGIKTARGNPACHRNPGPGENNPDYPQPAEGF